MLLEIRFISTSKRRSRVCALKIPPDPIGGREGAFSEDIPSDAERRRWSCNHMG